MNSNRSFSIILAFCLHIFVFICLCSIESIFFSPRSSFIEIDLWIVSLVFISLHRNIVTGLIFALITPLFMGAFSGLPYHAATVCFLIVLCSLHVIKSRSFAPGPSYFAICSFIAILTFYFSYFILSWVLGDSAIVNPSVIKWVISALTSSALFAVIRPLLIAVDSSFSIVYPFGFEVK